MPRAIRTSLVLPIFYAICLVIHNLLHVLVEEELQHQRHIVTVQEKLRQKLELENIYHHRRVSDK